MLNHESRKTDFWWQFKVSDLLYELENYYNNIEKKQNENKHSYCIQLNSYHSAIDSSTQHYLLITPDALTNKDTLPLVVTIRPIIENLYHFLSSPQLARYWSLSNAKYLANKYKYIIVMPAARLYLNEEFIPLAEKEILLTIDDVKKRYNINSNKIYLEGNCSAGYRCLTFACHYPSLFAAIGLYAPVYHYKSNNNWIKNNSPENLIANLSNIPILLHYDPLDAHSPYSFFEDFITDGKKYNLNLNVSSSKHSGRFYNTMLVGEETFKFFKGKRRIENSQQLKYTTYNEKYNSASWIKWQPIVIDAKTNIIVDYKKLENKITFTCKNISELSVNLRQLCINKESKLKIEVNNKIVYDEIFKKPTLHLEFNQNKKLYNNLFASEKIVADLFAEPFYFVTDTANGNIAYRQAVRLLIKEYEVFLFASPPVVEAKQLSMTELKNRNLFFIGIKFNNPLIMNGISKLPIRITDKLIEIERKSYLGKDISFQSVFISPFNPTKLIVIYGTNNQINFSHQINCPWKNGLENTIIYRNKQRIP